MHLKNTFISQVKPTGKPAGDKYSDGDGMYLLVKSAGKYWRMDYRHLGKRKTLAIGTYPEVSLAKARERRAEARTLLAEGIDPSAAKKAQKRALSVAAANTFEHVARELHGVKCGSWSSLYGKRWLERMEKDLFPFLGSKAIAEIKAPELLSVLTRIEKRGANETAHTLRQTAGQVFRYGIQTGRCERDPTSDLHGALKPIVVKHMAAVLEPAKAGELMRAIDAYTGSPLTNLEARLTALERSHQADALARPITDVERAVRLMHFIHGPKSPRRTKLIELLQSMGSSEELHLPGKTSRGARCKA